MSTLIKRNQMALLDQTNNKLSFANDRLKDLVSDLGYKSKMAGTLTETLT